MLAQKTIKLHTQNRNGLSYHLVLQLSEIVLLHLQKIF